MDGSEEEELCPLCLEPLDETDRRVLSYCGGVCSFLPCLFCHQRLLVENQTCPNCRQPYDQDKVLVEQARWVFFALGGGGRKNEALLSLPFKHKEEEEQNDRPRARASPQRARARAKPGNQELHGLTFGARACDCPGSRGPRCAIIVVALVVGAVDGRRRRPSSDGSLAHSTLLIIINHQTPKHKQQG
jgi:hypothetical protein